MLRALLIPLVLAATSLAASAQDDVARMRLLEGWREGGRHFAGVDIALAPGWKTYWRVPGEAGIPPIFDWAGSENLQSVRIHWPVPEVFEQSGMTSIGYSDRVILPIEVTPVDPGATVALSLKLDLGVCETICVPVHAAAEAALGADATRSDARIRSALADRPLSAAEAGVSDLDCDFSPTEDGVAVTARLAMPPVGRGEYAVIETGDRGLWVSEAAFARTGQRVVARAEVVPPPGAPLSLSRDALRLTILGPDSAVDIRGCG